MNEGCMACGSHARWVVVMDVYRLIETVQVVRLRTMYRTHANGWLVSVALNYYV